MAVRSKHGGLTRTNFGSGRKVGQPTGKNEGVVLHIISNKKTAKAPRGTVGGQNKFGFQGGDGAPSANVNGMPNLAGSSPSETATMNMISGQKGGPPSQAQSKKPEHWHQFSDGRIERGKRQIGDDGVCVRKLGGEHVAVGRKITFELPPTDDGESEEDEGLVMGWGSKGVQVIDAEGEHINVYWKEITAIEQEKKSKKRKKPKVPKAEVRKSLLERIFPWLG